MPNIQSLNATQTGSWMFLNPAGDRNDVRVDDALELDETGEAGESETPDLAASLKEWIFEKAMGLPRGQRESIAGALRNLSGPAGGVSGGGLAMLLTGCPAAAMGWGLACHQVAGKAGDKLARRITAEE